MWPFSFLQSVLIVAVSLILFDLAEYIWQVRRNPLWRGVRGFGRFSCQFFLWLCRQVLSRIRKRTPIELETDDVLKVEKWMTRFRTLAEREKEKGGDKHGSTTNDPRKKTVET